MTPNPVRVFYVGSRPLVYEALAKRRNYSVVSIWALKDSLLEKHLQNSALDFVSFAKSDKEHLIKAISETSFDILISNGCPIVLPISKLQAGSNKIFVNIHPSPLPRMRGFHPVNGALLHGERELGATAHYMNDSVDSGNIIAQERAPITPDLDLGLAYYVSFQLEPVVLEKALDLLENSGFSYPGEPQTDNQTCYSRSPSDHHLDFSSNSTASLLKRIKAFGLGSQGALYRNNGSSLVIFDAEEVSNPFLIERFKGALPGDVAHQYDDKLLIKTVDGMIKLTRFKRPPPTP